MDETVLRTLVIDFKREALRKGFKLTFSTIGTSMVPFIRSRNKIVVTDCDKARLKPGDLILFQGNNGSDKIIAHRIVKKIKEEDGYLFITKGDSSTGYDRPISGDMIIGKITEVRKPGFTIPLDSSFGRFINLCMLFISLSGIISLGHKIWRKIKPFLKHQTDYCPPK